MFTSLCGKHQRKHASSHNNPNEENFFMPPKSPQKELDHIEVIGGFT
jgi:hypothetical protein